MKLSVIVLSYNFRQFLEMCLQSIVDQQVDFQFEIIIGDDASSDGSESLIREFTVKYPNLIKPILHMNNIGAINNYFHLLKLSKGEYVAYCDGDDYMLPNKLQKQVEFLDQNPNYSMVVHPCKILIENNTIDEPVLPVESADINYLLNKGLFFNHSSKMFRKKYVENLVYPPQITRHPDYMLNIQSALFGRIGYLREYLGVYRKHSLGMSALNLNLVHKIYFEKMIMAKYIKQHNQNEAVRPDSIMMFESMYHYSAALRYLKIDKLRFIVHINKAKLFISRKSFVKRMIISGVCFFTRLRIVISNSMNIKT